MPKEIIRSHEFLSKTILNNFAINKNKNPKYVAYVYPPGKHVHAANTKTFNVKHGVYTAVNEAIMNREFETYLGDLQKQITEKIKKDGKLLAKDFDIDKIKKYFAYQCIRDMGVMKRLWKQREEYLQFQDYFMDYANCTEDAYKMRNTYISIEPEEHYFQNIFKDDSLVIAVDSSGRLIGSSYVVNLSQNGCHDTLGIALSPNVIFLLNCNPKKNMVLGYTHYAWKRLEQQDIDFINQRTLEVGRFGEGKIVISNSKKYLQELVDRFNT